MRARLAILLSVSLQCGGSVRGEPAGAADGSVDHPADSAQVVQDSLADSASAPDGLGPDVDRTDASSTTCAPVRRAWPTLYLTDEEYENTIADLLGEAMPADTPKGSRTGEHGFTYSPTPLREELARTLAKTFAGRAKAKLASLLPCDPAPPNEATCLRSFVESFGLRAFRRPLTSSELQTLWTLYESSRASQDLASAVAVVVERVLADPLFSSHRFDVATDANGKAYALASRLSYFLLRSMPDPALFAAAADGRLTTEADVEREARRLLATPRARGSVGSFYRQWLELDRFWTAPGTLMREETVRFATESFFADGLLTTLFEAKHSYLNSELAELYGQPSLAGTELRRVALVGPRAGLLTQGGILANSTSGATGTYPTRRGALVRRRMLCQDVPEPPLDVPSSVPPDPTLTNRENLQRSLEPKCVACHRLMDPIGFGFEGYDGTGRRRPVELGKPVDESGDLLDSRDDSLNGPFVGPLELASKLARSPEVAGCLSRQWFHYALSRRTAAEDDCSVESATRRFQRSLDLRELVVSIATSPSFRSVP